MRAIVAGIINTRTGEIVETTDKVSAKVPLELKVRDELGRDSFFVFEFNSMGGMGNLDYLRTKMQTTDGDVLKPVEVLEALYRAEQTEKALIRVQDELAVAEDARNECLELFSMGVNADKKREFVEDALSEAVSELRDEVNSLSHRYQAQSRRAEELRNRMANAAAAKAEAEEAGDLFEDMESLPNAVQILCMDMSDACENGDAYAILKDYLPRFEALGYTFEYGLDGVPYDLRRLAD